jgi:hypothetical protein
MRTGHAVDWRCPVSGEASNAQEGVHGRALAGDLHFEQRGRRISSPDDQTFEISYTRA